MFPGPTVTAPKARMPLLGSVYELKTLTSKQSVYAECPLNGKQCVDTEIGQEGRALRTQIKEWAVHVKECTVIAVALSVLSRLQSDRSLAGSASWVSALYLYRMHWHCPAGSARPVWDLHAAVLRQVDKLRESLQSTGLIQGIEEFGHHDRAEFEPKIYEVLQTRFHLDQQDWQRLQRDLQSYLLLPRMDLSTCTAGSGDLCVLRQSCSSVGNQIG